MTNEQLDGIGTISDSAEQPFVTTGALWEQWQLSLRPGATPVIEDTPAVERR
jgi:hypothetical protein